MEAVNPEMDGRSDSSPNVDDAQLRARISAAIVAGGGVTRLAARTGIPKGTLEKYAAETATASFVNAAKISAAVGLDLDEIAFSEGEFSKYGEFSRLKRRLNDQPFLSDANLGDDLIALPFYQDIAASAGQGLAVGTEAHDSVVAFARSFLRDHGATPERCSVIRARGDRMAPTIPDASLLIVDHAQAEVANGCIMVINVGEDLLVKRVRRRLDGLVDLVSDNPAYPPETIGRDTIQQLRIIGRVVYFCRVP